MIINRANIINGFISVYVCYRVSGCVLMPLESIDVFNVRRYGIFCEITASFIQFRHAIINPVYKLFVYANETINTKAVHFFLAYDNYWHTFAAE